MILKSRDGGNGYGFQKRSLTRVWREENLFLKYCLQRLLSRKRRNGDRAARVSRHNIKYCGGRAIRIQRGNDKVVAKVQTATTKTPVVEEESTRVY